VQAVSRIFLIFLILIGALNPAAYADCCDTESEHACCTLKPVGSHKENHADEKRQSKACHIQKAFPDGMEHFSCCTHLPSDFVESYTVRNQEKIQEFASPQLIFSSRSLFCEFFSNLYNNFYSKDSFGNISAPPVWLNFRNIRC
jgi:hypothetical protein